MNCFDYIIRQGDTLYSISRNYNVPLDVLMEANPFVNVYNLQVGEVICIPMMNGNQYNYTTYVIEDEEQLRSLLEEYGITLEEFLQYNNLDSVEPGMNIEVPVLDERPALDQPMWDVPPAIDRRIGWNNNYRR